MHISTFFLPSGDVVGIGARMVNWKPWYQVFHEYDSGESSSFYDGPDFEKSFQMYIDLLIAFKGISEAENFRKRIPQHLKQIRHLYRDQDDKQYHNLLQQKPKFLGINDWG
jgi:hypothetical protein